MIAAAIVDVLSTKFGLIKGKDIFAQQATGNKYIVVSATTVNSYSEIPFQRDAPINVIVAGYPVAEGELLAENIFNEILAMEGNSFQRTVSTIVQNYKVQGVTISSCPVMVPSSDSVVYTMNLRLMYQYTTTTP